MRPTSVDKAIWPVRLFYRTTETRTIADDLDQKKVIRTTTTREDAFEVTASDRVEAWDVAAKHLGGKAAEGLVGVQVEEAAR